MAKLDKKIIITGGGSGGHAHTALSFIQYLETKFSNAKEQILYIGGNLAMEGETGGKSIEQRLLEKSDLNYKIIRAGKLQRYFNFRTIALLFRVLGGLIDSFKILRKEKPDLIFSTGGYVTVPVCIAGWILKIPVYIHEQTTSVGLANKISAKFAKKVFTTFPQSKNYFPKKKTIHTGNLVKKDLFTEKKSGETSRVIEKMKKGKKQLPIVYISGGSQGSHILNATVREMMTYLVQYYQVILQTGENKVFNDYDNIYKDKQKLSTKVQSRFHPVKYIEASEIGYIYKNIDLFVGRAGANTVYELGLFKKPSILIPIPWTRNNEQQENAQLLEKLNLAKIIPEGELTPDKLFIEINKMFKEKKEINEEKIEKIFTQNAGDKILESMEI
jgi:UDP-N-acetylglucosamine--N-acetylmuramyl-(pentapeptide) pyrophosphoryl-undecaprenol N-acetylglucosamine transferase